MLDVCCNRPHSTPSVRFGQDTIGSSPAGPTGLSSESFGARTNPFFEILDLPSSVFICTGALGTPSRTGPLARKYLPGFPYSSSLRRLRQKISSTVICNYPSAAQEQPFTVGLFLIVFIRSCSSINNKITSLKNLFHHS